MATQTVEFSAAPGQTVTAKLFTAGSDTVVQTASAVTEGTNRDGVYSGTFTDAAAGRYRLIATNANGTKLADWWVDIALATGTYPAYEMPVSAIQSGLSTLDAAGVRSAVGLASADLDTQLADLPTVTEFEARTLLATGYFDAATDSVTVGTNNDKADYALSSTSRDAIVADFLAHVITKGSAGTIERAFWQAAKSQASAEGEVSGTPTVSAFDTDLTAVTGAFDDLLILFVSGSLTGEARPIASYSNTNGRITLQESLTAAPSAADEFLIIPSHTHPIADIQDGLATSAALAEAKTEIDKIPRQGSTHKHRQISSDGATKSAVVTIEAST
jgi:peptidoglycan hydrolase-like protein with peptidoglycan-binding domain